MNRIAAVALFALAACGGAPFTVSEQSAALEVADDSGSAPTKVAQEHEDAGDPPSDDAGRNEASAPDAGPPATVCQVGACENACPNGSPRCCTGKDVTPGVPGITSDGVCGCVADRGVGACVAAEADAAPPAADAAPEACSPLTHSNGYGESFQDCAPLGDWTQTLAAEACQTYANQGNVPSTAVVCALTECGGVPAIEFDNEACILWSWSGASAGHAIEGTLGGPCVCPTTSSATWF